MKPDLTTEQIMPMVIVPKGKDVMLLSREKKEKEPVG